MRSRLKLQCRSQACTRDAERGGGIVVRRRYARAEQRHLPEQPPTRVTVGLWYIS